VSAPRILGTGLQTDGDMGCCNCSPMSGCGEGVELHMVAQGGLALPTHSPAVHMPSALADQSAAKFSCAPRVCFSARGSSLKRASCCVRASVIACARMFKSSPAVHIRITAHPEGLSSSSYSRALARPGLSLPCTCLNECSHLALGC